MKNLLLALILVFATGTMTAQKLKGSRAVTLSQKEISEFDSIEVSDDIEVFLISSDKSGVEIEADDNLHDAMNIEVSAGMLRISAKQQVTGAKKFSVKISYTNSLSMIVLKGATNCTVINELTVDNLTVKTFDASRFFGSARTKKFTLMGNDKSKIELNLIAERCTVELSNNANLKALLSSAKLTFDMYQKSVATIEGDAIDMKLRLDNNASFTGKNMTATNLELLCEDYSSASIIATAKVSIAAGGKSEIQLYGDPKIELTKFADSAMLQKKVSTGKVN